MPPSLEVAKFAMYVFIPIGILALVNSTEYQEKYVKPYTLFPSAGRGTIENDIMPNQNESREEWEKRMRDSKAVRVRAAEIFQEMKSTQQKQVDKQE